MEKKNDILLKIKFALEILLIMLLAINSIFAVENIRYHDSHPTNYNPISHPNAKFETLLGEDKAKEKVKQMISNIETNNDYGNSPIGVKYFSDTLSCYTDVDTIFDKIIYDLTIKPNTARFSMTADYNINGEIVIVKIVCDDYLFDTYDNFSVIEVSQMHLDYVNGISVISDEPNSKTSNQNINYSFKNYLLVELSMVIIAIVCLVICILHYKKLKERLKIDQQSEMKKSTKIETIIILVLLSFCIYFTYTTCSTINNFNFRNEYGNVSELKPIIYIYPNKETKLVVKAKYPELFTCTYPKYDTEKGWHILATEDGTLYNLTNVTGENIEEVQKLYSLYWEGDNPRLDTKMDEGFCVKGEDTIKFLEEKLTLLGLNYKEQEEFIVYWLPKLEKNKYNYIRFATTEECNKYMPLEFTEVLEDGSSREAQIDNLIRILMIYKPLNGEIEVKEQEIITPSRDGFTVVEWGGSEL